MSRRRHRGTLGRGGRDPQNAFFRNMDDFTLLAIFIVVVLVITVVVMGRSLR